MKLIPAKCPDCGADIKITEGSTSLICEYCGGNIIVTDLLGATSVMQNCMILAYSAMETGNYSDAYDHFNRAIEIDLKNPNAWFGKAVSFGMTAKISDDVFCKMIALFENAVNYAPEDKKANLKKNAAAEIVKVMRHNENLVQMAIELSSFNDDEQFVSMLTAETKKLKETVLNTVQKALEYDNTNNDAKMLLDEVTSGIYFTGDKKGQNENDNNIPSVFNFPGNDKNSPPVSNKQQNSVSQTGNTTSVKKSGCSMVLIFIFIAIASTGVLIGIL